MAAGCGRSDVATVHAPVVVRDVPFDETLRAVTAPIDRPPVTVYVEYRRAYQTAVEQRAEMDKLSLRMAKTAGAERDTLAEALSVARWRYDRAASESNLILDEYESVAAKHRGN